jgi:SAM-dependent methyltransferase
MSVEEHIRFFDRIALPYSISYRIARNSYRRLLETHLVRLGLPKGVRVLDVGCGPGSMAAAFADMGFSVHGVDGAPRMAAIAARNGIPCSVADATAALPFADGSFDLAVAGWVAHGIHQPARERLYREMRRVAAKAVLLHDYSPSERGFPLLSVMGLLERLERSDYVAFRQGARGELESVFDRVEIIPINARASWYYCR